MGMGNMKMNGLRWISVCILLLGSLPSNLAAQFLHWDYKNMVTDTVQSGAYADMKIGPNGTIHVSYWQKVEGKLVYAWKSLTDVSWHYEYVDPVHENGFRSSICLDLTGNVHIAYYESVNSMIGIRFATRTAPGAWDVEALPDIYGRGYGDYGPLGTITSKERVQHSLELVYDENNKPQIAFFDGWMRIDAFPACISSSDYGFKLHQGIRVNGQWIVRSLGHVHDYHNSCNTFPLRDSLPKGDRYGEYLNLLMEPDGTMDIFSMSRFNNEILRHRTLFPFVDTVWEKTGIDSLGLWNPLWLTYLPGVGFGPNFSRFYTWEGLSAKYSSDDYIHLAYSSSIFYGDNYCCISLTNDLVYTRVDPAGGPPFIHRFGRSTYRNYTDVATRGGSDSLFILYNDLSSLYFIVQESADSGNTWVADTVLAGIGIGSNHLEVYGDSLVAVIFDASNERLLLVKRHVNGGDWRIEEITHSQARGESLDAQYLVTGNDTILHTAFNDGYTGALYYARGTKATGWNWAISQLDPSASDAVAVALATSVAGDPIVVYNGGPNRDLRVAKDSAGIWKYSVVLPSGNPQFIDVAVSSLDSIHVVYYDGNQNCLHHAVGHVNGAPWRFEDITCDTSSVGLFPSLALDAAGLPHIAYYNDINRSLYYAHFDGGTHTWIADSIRGGSSSAIGKFNDLLLDANGLAKIAYLDEQSDAVFLSELAANGTWTHTTVDSQNISNIGRPISMQIDDLGKVWIAYNYYSNFEKVKLLHRDGAIWREVAVSTAGRIANAFKFKIIGGDLFIVGKKNEIQNTGVAMLYARNGVYVEASEANLLTHNVSVKNFPNPSDGKMTFELDVATPITLTLEIRDLLGHKVASVMQDQRFSTGLHDLSFDGSALAPGIYLYELRSASSRIVSKMSIVR